MDNTQNISRVLNYIDYICRNNIVDLNNNNFDAFKTFGIQLGKLNIEINTPNLYTFTYTYNNSGVVTELTFTKKILENYGIK